MPRGPQPKSRQAIPGPTPMRSKFCGHRWQLSVPMEDKALTTWLTIAVAIGGAVAAGSPTNPKRIASASIAQALPFDTAGWKLFWP